jgi:hypothetical protein
MHRIVVSGIEYRTSSSRWLAQSRPSHPSSEKLLRQPFRHSCKIDATISRTHCKRINVCLPLAHSEISDFLLVVNKIISLNQKVV